MGGALLTLWFVMAAQADDIRLAVGGQLETEGNGILDFGWRRGPLSVQLFTDTLDLRITQAEAWGRWSVGVRAAAFAAGMWITPWRAGAPDPTRAQRASYLGGDADVQRYLPGGLWVGAAGWIRPHTFVPLKDATLEVPNTLWTRADLTAGLWRDEGVIQSQLAVGVDATDPGGLSPHGFLEAKWSPAQRVAPIVALRGGLAQGQNDIIATRIGGLTPYTIPLAGAAWAEIWAEDYGAARLGGRVEAGPFTVGAAVDAVTWTLPVTTTDQVAGGSALGLEGRVTWRDRAMFAELAAGYSPTLQRADGVWPVPIYLLIGTQWVQPGS